MKHGIALSPKVKFNARRAALAGLMLLLWLTGCAQATVQANPPVWTPTHISGTPQVFVRTSPPTILPGTPLDQATPTVVLTPRPPILYYTQPNDTLPAVAARFGVPPETIGSADPSLPATVFLPLDMLLLIPDVLDETGPEELLLPDSEIVYSPSAVDFDVRAYIAQTNGYLASYTQPMEDGMYDAARVVQRVATENSCNPRLLIALLEYQSGWVTGQPRSLVETDYPLGYVSLDHKGLYKQLAWACQKLGVGYYGWRDGSVLQVQTKDKQRIRLAPRINAGTAALSYYFAQIYDQPRWAQALYSSENFLAFYTRMFDDPWTRAQTVEPLLPPFLTQPELQLPFGPGQTWALTGGPHAVWSNDSVMGAIDLAPNEDQNGCYTSQKWVTAVAPGRVVRTSTGVVVVDLDGDGYEQTGWVILYMHIATRDKVSVGDWVDQDGKIGHPSCEGGRATGTHVHIARKYNGEWIPTAGPLPFVLSGWMAHNGAKPYEGTMTRGDEVAEASVYGDYRTLVTRPAAP